VESGLCGTGQDRLLLILMVERSVLGGTPTAQREMEATVVPPVDPFQDDEFDLVDSSPLPRRLISLVLNSPFTVSAIALSKLFPGLPIEPVNHRDARPVEFGRENPDPVRRISFIRRS
jgi:hypothetical protein